MVAAGFFLVFLIGEAISEAIAENWEATIGVEGILLAILIVIALLGSILSWWRERLAVILLVLVSIGLGIHIGVYAGRNHFLAWSMVGLPYLVAGGLLLYAWWLERKTV
jgi:predicted RND superfamily exporter protein